MLTVCYINRQSGRGYHYSDTNACGESAASNMHGSILALDLFIYFILFIQYLKRFTLSAEVAILPSGPL